MKPIVDGDDYRRIVAELGGRLPYRVAGVSGGTGFVGSHLVGLLRLLDVAVRVLVRGDQVPDHLAGPGITIVRGDVRDRDACRELARGCDVLFHTAAVVSPWVREPIEQYDVAVCGTRWLVEAGEELAIPVVCTSSIVTDDPYPPPRAVQWLDGNHYVRSKRIARELVRHARRRGVRVSTIVPSGIIGPGDYRPTAIGRLVLDAMSHRAPPFVFAGGLYLVDVRDVAEAHVRAAIAPPDDHVLAGELWTLQRLFGAISDRPGPLPAQIPIPGAVAFAGAAAMSAWSTIVTRRAPLITPAWVHYFRLAPSMTYDDHSERLGIALRPITSAVADTVGWYTAAHDA